MSDETIEQFKVRWEEVRQRVRALEFTAQFYAERNQQLIDENRELKGYIEAADRSISDLAEVQVKMNELLWWVTADVSRNMARDNVPWVEVWEAIRRVRQMLATQGYTRENLEKH